MSHLRSGVCCQDPLLLRSRFPLSLWCDFMGERKWAFWRVEVITLLVLLISRVGSVRLFVGVFRSYISMKLRTSSVSSAVVVAISVLLLWLCFQLDCVYLCRVLCIQCHSCFWLKRLLGYSSGSSFVLINLWRTSLLPSITCCVEELGVLDS